MRDQLFAVLRVNHDVFRVIERPEPRKPWHDSKHGETSASLCDSSARERVVESCFETRARVNKPSLFPTCSSRMFSISTLILGVFFQRSRFVEVGSSCVAHSHFILVVGKSLLTLLHISVLNLACFV